MGGCSLPATSCQSQPATSETHLQPATQTPQEADTLFELAQEEQARAGSGASAAARWGAHAAASCIYESIPGHSCTPELRSSYDAYRRHRCSWPLRPGVWRLLFHSRLSQLVAALLGPAAVLFNDQVS